MIKVSVIHTGKVYVSPALPFKDKIKNPNPFQLSLLSLYGRKNRIWLPVSAYLIEHPKGLLLFDTGWSREVSPRGEYDRIAQVKHMGVGHFLINQAILPKGEALVEQLAEKNIFPSNIDCVILSHLHTDHASGLKQLIGAKKFLVSAPELDDTKKFPIRYVSSMWDGINFETFDFAETGAGPVGKSFDLFGDGTIELINIPGHTSGLAAMKISNGGKFVLLFSDGGYAEKSWCEEIPPGTALDENLALKSLQWISKVSKMSNCVESLANHDPNIIPHEIFI